MRSGRRSLPLLVLALGWASAGFAAEPADVLSDPQIFRQVVRKVGDDGVKSYRIPGLAVSTKGTLLAVYDIRYNGPKDLPADVDVGLSRSRDLGRTWEPMQTILDFDKNVPNSQGNGVGDPAILVDPKTGAIFVAALWSQGNRAWFGSGPGLKPDETAQFVLTRSDDDGATWSSAINITAQIKRPEWRLCFQGPGAGIALRDGGLVFAAQFKGTDGVAHSCFILSRDHGRTWAISPAAVPDPKLPTSESQIVELADGSLLLSMRCEARSGQRRWARWEWTPKSATEPASQAAADGSEFRSLEHAGKWSEHWLAVTDPTCMASVLRLPDGRLLISNPNHPKQRVAMTMRTSADLGRTWTEGRLLDPRGSMYSCLTNLPGGDVGILYEVAGTLTFARIPVGWIDQNVAK